MNQDEFKKELDNNLNLQLIIAGMTGLVDQGYSPREVFKLMDTAKQNTFHALSEMSRGDA
ncbi:hypothetical protein [Virgibacillus salexigens]|uniref:hypothetical protein n=1 Tax=Virgibacillus salexigens TaxID=61016 RepID=UPI0019098E83|nr:hypothetical protein [Virgibacillus salexigens]